MRNLDGFKKDVGLLFQQMQVACQNSEMFSPRNDENYPFMTMYYPDTYRNRKTMEKEGNYIQGTPYSVAQACLFSEKWMPEGVRVAHADKVVIHVRKSIDSKETEPRQVSMQTVNLPVTRSEGFREPLLPNHPRFEEIIKNLLLGLSDLLKEAVKEKIEVFEDPLNYPIAEQKHDWHFDHIPTYYFYSLMETRNVNNFGYLPNRVSYAATVAVHVDSQRKLLKKDVRTMEEVVEKMTPESKRKQKEKPSNIIIPGK